MRLGCRDLNPTGRYRDRERVAGQFPVPGCGVDRIDDRTSRSDPASESGSGSAGYREGPEHATEGLWKLESSARLFRYTENCSRVGVTWRRAACSRESGLLS